MALHDLPRKRLTYEDYVLFPDDGNRHEIIDGEHYVTAAPFVRHQRIVVRLTVSLGRFLEQHPLGELLVAPTDILLSPHDIVQPDLFFISNERSAITKDANIQGAPDLVIEILSDSTRRRDETLKRDRYERFGVLEYWIVDPQRRTVRVFRRSGPGFLAAQEFSAVAGDLLATPLFVGLAVQVSEIFE